MIRWIAMLALLLSPPALAAPSPSPLAARADEVVQVLQGEREAASVFADSFLAAVPPAQLAALLTEVEAQSGKLIDAREVTAKSASAAHLVLHFERAEADASLTIETARPFKVTGFRIGAVRPLNDSAEKIAADFAALPGRSSFAVFRLGDGAPQPIVGAPAGPPLAIGSTFKLWVLDALAQDIAEGRHRWDEVVRLGPRSLPGGMTQDWPQDAPLTVETLATLMISISDNTATDTLIRLIGRDRIAARVRATFASDPSAMLPLLMTSEAFALKLSTPALRERYAASADEVQEQILRNLDAMTILGTADRSALSAGPVAIDGIEWFASPADIAAVFDSLRRRSDSRVLQILGIAPALPPALGERFAYVGYKGGSEIGVINLSWLLRGKSGEWSVVTASWNDPAAAIDGERFEALVQRLVRLVE